MRIAAFFFAAATACLLTACGWKPTVSVVPLTAPWSELNLPVQDGAAVWASSPAQFKAQHKGDRRAVLAAYVEAFKRQGWSLVKFDQSRSNWYVDLAKGSAKIQIELYDFKKTGVIIQKL